MWICPHKVSDYSQVQAFREDPNRYQPAVVNAQALSWPYGPCECKNHFFWLSSIYLTTYRLLLAVDIGSSISNFAVANALRPFNLDVCPQIKLNDPVVLKRFSEDFQKSQDDCNCKGCRSPRRAKECVVCKATFKFEFGVKDEPLNGKRVLKFLVRRNLDDFQDVPDPDWTSQLSYPSEVSDLKRV